MLVWLAIACTARQSDPASPDLASLRHLSGGGFLQSDDSAPPTDDSATAADDSGTKSDDSGADDSAADDSGPDDSGTIIDWLAPDFTLVDLNPVSPTYKGSHSPRDYLKRVSGWYFTHAT